MLKMQLLTYKLQDNPPEWAKEALWYYENAHGEQWSLQSKITI